MISGKPGDGDEMRRDFTRLVAEYRAEKRLELANRGRILDELRDMEGYLAIYDRHEVDDTFENTTFIRHKINVLKVLLGLEETELDHTIPDPSTGPELPRAAPSMPDSETESLP